MESGKLRHELVIQSASESRGTDGAVVKTWSTFATVWGSVNPIRAREQLQSGQLQADVTHKLLLRYLPGLTHEHRIMVDGRVFEIVSLMNVAEADQVMEVLAVERDV